MLLVCATRLAVLELENVLAASRYEPFKHTTPIRMRTRRFTPSFLFLPFLIDVQQLHPRQRTYLVQWSLEWTNLDVQGRILKVVQ